MQARTSIAVLTADLGLLDQVLSSAAAAKVEAEVVPDAGVLLAGWGAATAIVVGIDRVGELARATPVRRSEVYLVGAEADREELLRWSPAVGAAVVVLPRGARELTGNLADAAGQRHGPGSVIAVLGGSGGVGASTCAGALALAAARRRRSVLLLDADGWSGGLDLLLGAERTPGWRWDALARARGHLGDVSEHLPRVEGVDLLSMRRSTADGVAEPGAEQMSAVLGAAGRTHDLVVVDLPRRVDDFVLAAVDRVDLGVLVVRGDVRGVAAAQQARSRVLDLDAVGVVVRTRRRGVLSPAAVAEALSARLLGAVGDDPGVRLAAERGDLPLRPARAPLSRACEAILDRVALVDRAA